MAEQMTIAEFARAHSVARWFVACAIHAGHIEADIGEREDGRASLVVHDPTKAAGAVDHLRRAIDRASEMVAQHMPKVDATTCRAVATVTVLDCFKAHKAFPGMDTPHLRTYLNRFRTVWNEHVVGSFVFNREKRHEPVVALGEAGG